MDKVLISNNEFPTLVALTEEEQARGLMYVKPPAPIMCFPFKNATIRRFWMKSCPSPLDIIFCSANKIVDICYGEPFSTKMVGPNVPTDFVVEMPAGSAKKYSVAVGDDVRLIPTLATIARQIIV
jgi:uncharacterized membrane protein (UPF0127 family)